MNPPAPPSEATELREIAGLLCLWRFCACAACGRVRACRGAAYRCLPRYSPRVPEGARTFLIRLFNAREFGYSFDEAVTDLAAESRALAAWSGSAQVAGSLLVHYRRRAEVSPRVLGALLMLPE